MYTKLSLRPQMKISPQLVITGQLLQVPGYELEQFINSELVKNPALELTNKPANKIEHHAFARADGPLSSRSTSISGSRLERSSSFEEAVEKIAHHQSPLEKLSEQIALTQDQADREIAISLLHRLDHRGFLVTPIEQLANEMGISKDAVKSGIEILQQLEPPGIGARNLQECFLIQCAHLESEGVDCQYVRQILTLAWNEFLAQKWDKVSKKIEAPRSSVEGACRFMRLNFDPHPLAILSNASDTEASLYGADLLIRRNSHTQPPTYVLEIPGEEDFELRIALSFQKIAEANVQREYGLSTEESTWIATQVDRARMLMDALCQRWGTLRRIGEYLIRHQSEFLEKGPLYLRPLTRATLAQDLNLHESTISRAVANKIIQLPSGRLIPLSDFFDPSLAAKEAIRRLLRENPQRLCDREIVAGLQSKGIHLSRRTITKYRREISLDSSRPQSLGI